MKQSIYLIILYTGILILLSCKKFNDPPIAIGYRIPESSTDGIAVDDAAKHGMKKEYLAALTNHTRTDAFKGIHSVLVLKNDTLIYEEYFNGYDKNTLHNLYSASKSFTSILTGIAIDKGALKLSDPVLPWFPEYAPVSNNSPSKQAVTVSNLLTMSSGLACNDQDPSSPGQDNNIYKQDDVLKYLWNLPMENAPGTTPSYCSGGVITLAALISKSTHTTYTDFAEQTILTPLEIYDYTWNFRNIDKTDRPDEIFLRPRDMGKFGLLILHKGLWGNQQIVSEQWINESTTKKVFLKGFDYGYLWWLRTITIKGQTMPLISAEGNGGQFIFILPTLNMVMVSTGGNIDSPLSGQGFSILYDFIIPAALN